MKLEVGITKLSRGEIAAVALTLLFIAFTAGVNYGGGRSRDSYTIITEKSEETPAPSEPDSAAEPENADGLININTASEQELTRLNGIGEKLAGRIVEYRETNGDFADVRDITRVQGIGSGVYEKIKDSITVG